jgi:hypothetical protein
VSFFSQIGLFLSCCGSFDYGLFDYYFSLVTLWYLSPSTKVYFVSSMCLCVIALGFHLCESVPFLVHGGRLDKDWHFWAFFFLKFLTSFLLVLYHIPCWS